VLVINGLRFDPGRGEGRRYSQDDYHTLVYLTSNVVFLFRDRVRTAVNVMGDCYCSGVMSHWFQDEFEHATEEETEVVINHNKCEQTSF
jgi:hypothetical protein